MAQLSGSQEGSDGGWYGAPGCCWLGSVQLSQHPGRTGSEAALEPVQGGVDAGDSSGSASGLGSPCGWDVTLSMFWGSHGRRYWYVIIRTPCSQSEHAGARFRCAPRDSIRNEASESALNCLQFVPEPLAT